MALISARYVGAPAAACFLRVAAARHIALVVTVALENVFEEIVAC